MHLYFISYHDFILKIEMFLLINVLMFIPEQTDKSADCETFHLTLVETVQVCVVSIDPTSSFSSAIHTHIPLHWSHDHMVMLAIVLCTCLFLSWHMLYICYIHVCDRIKEKRPYRRFGQN